MRHYERIKTERKGLTEKIDKLQDMLEEQRKEQEKLQAENKRLRDALHSKDGVIEAVEIVLAGLGIMLRRGYDKRNE